MSRYDADDVYCFPGTAVLKNKAGITDQDLLDEYEGDFTAIRLLELTQSPVEGSFDLAHLCKIALPKAPPGPLEGVLVSWEKRVAKCLSESIEIGELAPGQDPQALSRFFWVGWEGAILRSKLMRSLEPIDQFTSIFFRSVIKI